MNFLSVCFEARKVWVSPRSTFSALHHAEEIVFVGFRHDKYRSTKFNPISMQKIGGPF